MLWAYYKQAPPEIQKDILQQLNLPEFLKGLAPKYQKEVLASAPKEVVQNVSILLTNYTYNTTDKLNQLLDRNGMVMK